MMDDPLNLPDSLIDEWREYLRDLGDAEVPDLSAFEEGATITVNGRPAVVTRVTRVTKSE